MGNALFRNSQLYILFGITFVAIMGVASVTPALPIMARHFGKSPESMSMMITAFTLPGIFLTPVAGLLADRYGRKVVLVPSLVLFGIAGTLCAFATSFEVLLACRFFQGMGASPLGALYASLIGDIFSAPKQRMQVMAYAAAIIGFGGSLFPLLGGALASLGWNGPFFLCASALILAVVVHKGLHVNSPREKESVGLYLRDLIRLAAQPNMRRIFALIFLCFFLMYGPIITFFPILAGMRFTVSPGDIGVILTASSLGTMTVSSQLARLEQTFSMKKLLLIGGVFYMISMTLMPFMPNKWLFMLPLFFFGMAHGFCYPNLATQLINLAPAGQRAGLMSLNGTLLRVTQTLAPLFFSLVLMLGSINSVYFAGIFFGFLVLVLGRIVHLGLDAAARKKT